MHALQWLPSSLAAPQKGCSVRHYSPPCQHHHGLLHLHRGIAAPGQHRAATRIAASDTSDGKCGRNSSSARTAPQRGWHPALRCGMVTASGEWPAGPRRSRHMHWRAQGRPAPRQRNRAYMHPNAMAGSHEALQLHPTPPCMRTHADASRAPSVSEQLDAARGATLSVIQAVLAGDVAAEDAAQQLAAASVAAGVQRSRPETRQQESPSTGNIMDVICQPTGVPEVVFGQGKAVDQLAASLLDISQRQRVVLATRVEPAMYAAVRKVVPGGFWGRCGLEGRHRRAWQWWRTGVCTWQWWQWHQSHHRHLHHLPPPNTPHTPLATQAWSTMRARTCWCTSRPTAQSCLRLSACRAQWLWCQRELRTSVWCVRRGNGIMANIASHAKCHWYCICCASHRCRAGAGRNASALCFEEACLTGRCLDAPPRTGRGVPPGGRAPGLLCIQVSGSGRKGGGWIARQLAVKWLRCA